MQDGEEKGVKGKRGGESNDKEIPHDDSTVLSIRGRELRAVTKDGVEDQKPL